MCGICGAIGIESRESGEAIVRRMMAAIVHRGPDEEGILEAPLVTLGVRRLSIIDLPGGSQPVWNESGTLAVVFNGEIYNFRELREELESKGHRFLTRSDTEVIVHAYEAWGEDCVLRLRGMFAFAIAETPQGRGTRPTRVFLARDPLGIKPLYYSGVDGAFYFASEVRALLASGYVPARLSREAVSSYLLFGSVSEPATLVEGVNSLPPGHGMSIVIGRPANPVSPRPYRDIPRDVANVRRKIVEAGGRTQSLIPQVRSLLEDAVRSHLVADVPVGVFLSSGLDSTVVTALATRAQSDIHTFTVAFPEAEFSEAAMARSIARRLGTDHREFTLSDQEMLSSLDKAIGAFDQPSMDGINTYFVSWAARQAGLKVALSGLGSDEIFGGYSSFRATTQVARLKKFADFLPRPMRELLAPGLKAAKSVHSSPDAYRKASAAWIDPASLPHPYFFTRTLFPPPVMESIVNDGSTSWTSTPWARWLSEAARQAENLDEFTAVSWLEARSYLVNTLLRDTDAMSMRNSLEVRVPFLDFPLFEYVLALPESVKRDSGQPKSLLIQALSDLLPFDLIAQPKRTFTFPWKKWLRGPLGERVAKGLAEWAPALESEITGAAARRVWDDFLNGRTSWSRPWSLYVLNEWVKRNLIGHPISEPDRPRKAAASVA